EMLGYAAEEIPKGARFRCWLLQRTQPEDRKRLGEALSALGSGRREEVSEEVAVRCASGRYLPVHLQARPARWYSGKRAAGVVGVLHDQSARREIEERLEEGRILAERRAEELQRLALELTESEERERRRLARVLHDELQQYLAAGKLRLSGAEGLNKAELEQVTREASELLDRAIGVSRSLTSELSPTVLYTAGLTAALAWLGEWMELHHELAVEVHAESAAEPQSSGIRILLFQAARELLFNVVKHSGAQRAVLSLEREGQDSFVLIVSDHGKGFDPDALVGRKGADRGFGLLSISERLQLLGGSARIDSRPGRGTSVVVSVSDRVMWTEAGTSPFAQSTVGGAGLPGEPRAGGRAPTRVLIADDHAVVRQGFASLMQRTPEIEVVALASDGEMAVRLADSLRPEVVLMDVAMPQMSGIEATRRIHRDHPEIRVIGLSVHDEKETRRAMLEAGAVEYLTKDGPAELLLTAIRGGSVPGS
ncbi:MAG: response regulator, partial [Spirochaetales bacterium]|nr:response regulator [Spirochaetales bacterium]